MSKKNDTSHCPLGSFGADERATEPLPFSSNIITIMEVGRVCPIFAFPAESDGVGDFVIGSSGWPPCIPHRIRIRLTSKLRRLSGYESPQIQRIKLAGAGRNLALVGVSFLGKVVPGSPTYLRLGIYIMNEAHTGPGPVLLCSRWQSIGEGHFSWSIHHIAATLLQSQR